MSTEFTVNGEQFAVRFATKGGAQVQMFVTPTEFEAFRGQRVVSEMGEDVGTAEEFVAQWEGRMAWDTAARRNEFARQMENHRFEECRQAAPAIRASARAAAKDAMGVV